MKLTFFNKGINVRKADHLIEEGEGVVYENIDNSKGHFKPIKQKEATSIPGVNNFGYYDYLNSVWRFSATIQDYVLYGNNLYTSNRTTRPTKINSSNQENLLGIDAPVNPGVTERSQNGATNSLGYFRVNKIAGGSTNPAGTVITYIFLNGLVEREGVLAGDLEYLYNYLFVESLSLSQRNAWNNGSLTVTAFLDLIPDRFKQEITEFDTYNDDGTDREGTVITGNVVTITSEADNEGYTVERLADIQTEEDKRHALHVYAVSNNGRFRAVYGLNGIQVNGGQSLPETPLADTRPLFVVPTNSLEIITTGLTGYFQYTMTYYNENDGAESGPMADLIGKEFSDTSKEQVFNGYIELSNLPTAPADPQVTHKKLYRIGGASSKFIEVAQLDLATTVYKDTVPSISTSLPLLSTQQFIPPPAGLRYLVENNAMFFGALGSLLRFTPVDTPDSWPELFFLKFPSTITGIAVIQLGLLVFTQRETYLVSGTGPTTLTKQLLTKDQGCINHDTIVNVKGSAIWQSYDGLCISNGGTPAVLTKKKLDRQNFSSVHAVVYNEQYFLQLQDNSIFVWDYRFEPIAKYINDNTTSLAVANNQLYGFNGTTAYLMENSTANAVATFRTGKLFLASIITEKLIDSFFVHAEAGVSIEVLINGTSVGTYVTTSGNSKIKLPKVNTRYTFVEFIISGAAELYELLWVDEDGNN